MNIKDFIKQKKGKKPTKKSVELDGQTVDFWVKQESAYDQITMLENSGQLMSAILKMNKAKEAQKKIDEAIEKDPEYVPTKEEKERAEFAPTGEETAALRKHRSRQAQYLMCDENGLPLFSSLDDFLKTFEPDQIDKISEVIEETDTVDEAEKNL